MRGGEWIGKERKATALAWTGWCRSGMAPWAALCRAATEKECWQILLDRAARVQFAKVCVLREGERP